MGIGGGQSAPKPKPIAPPPTEMSAEVEVAKNDLRMKQRLAASRSKSQVTQPGMFTPLDTQKPFLKTKLG